MWGSLSSTGGTIQGISDPTNNPLWINEGANGTEGGTATVGYFGLNTIKVTDNLATGADGPASALEVQDNYGGGNFSGGRSALIAWLNPSSAGLGAGAAQNFYGAATFIADANQSAGGTSTSCGTCGGGHIYGINPTASLSNGATNWQNLAGEEIDLTAKGTNTSFISKTGLFIVLKSDNVVPGAAGVDTAIGISGSSSQTAGWNYGLSFGGRDGAYPFQPTSTLIYGGVPSGGSPSAAWGIDMLVPAFSSGFARSTGFQVDGAGTLSAQAVNIANFAVQPSVNGLSITAPSQIARATGPVPVTNAALTQFWGIGDKALTQYGGLYEVVSLVTDGGGVVTSSTGTPSSVVTITVQPGFQNAACIPYPSYLGTVSASGTLGPLTTSVVGTCTALPNNSGNGTWAASSSGGGLTNITLNVPFRVRNVAQLVPDVTPTPPPVGTSVLGTQTNCYITSTGTAGFFSACGAPLQLPLSFGPANDITLGSAIGTASATTGFSHPFPSISTAPTGTPVTPGVACAWDTATHVLNCYDGADWYHIPGVAGAG